MKICGIKLTHDAAVAGVTLKGRTAHVAFNTEIEKLRNNPRYSKLLQPDDIRAILAAESFAPEQYVIDGWKRGAATHNTPVAGYHEHDYPSDSLLKSITFPSTHVLPFGYKSYTHLTGHIMGAYCTSPYSARREPAHVVVMDGGTQPRLFYLDPEERELMYIGNAHELYGFIYGAMGRYFGPYRIPGIELKRPPDMTDEERMGGYEVPGKIMAYIAHGSYKETLARVLDSTYAFYIGNTTFRDYNQSGEVEHLLLRAAYSFAKDARISDEYALRTIHDWLGGKLVAGIRRIVGGGNAHLNLIFTGGSALNIKWNTALRREFGAVWVPPFPNDSGSALGAALTEAALVHDVWHASWSVYSGPKIAPGNIPEGWTARKASLTDLAARLAAEPERPILYLSGRAESGPRALGARSILMAASSPRAKSILNAIKGREEWRPVAPLVMSEHAARYFDPGTRDPYMLFEHRVRDNARALIPAVTHLDGTARLQTVSASDNHDIHSLLRAYRSITGVPVLCNTSANLNGSGFFPTVEDAMAWGRIDTIYSDGTLYQRI